MVVFSFQNRLKKETDIKRDLIFQGEQKKEKDDIDKKKPRKKKEKLVLCHVFFECCLVQRHFVRWNVLPYDF